MIFDLLYCKGDAPVSDLNAREKYEILLNPQFSLIVMIDASLFNSISFARVILVFKTYCMIVTPTFSLKSLQRWYLLI